MDEEIPLTLPDTQQVEDTALSQENTPTGQVIWGRLCPNKPRIKQFIMSKNEYTLGRSPKCDINLTINELSKNEIDVISKVHFRITRKLLNGSTSDPIIYLEDLSSNGTFVNHKVVGKGEKVILCNNDVLSLAKPNLEVYTYLSCSNPENDRLPPELRSKYAVSRTLGTGLCGDVKLILGIFSGKKFALKTISKKNLTVSNANFTALNPERIKTEVQILKSLKHPFIIKMEEILDTPSCMFIVLEMMEGGELFDRILHSEGLPEDVAKHIFYQVVHAVSYLHKKGITHRDLKPENILLASNDEYPLVKVTDFGLSKFVNDETMMRTFCGTPMYLAPEILRTDGKGFYTKQVDVWSLGVILYVSLAGRTPFFAHHARIPLHDQILQGKYTFSPSCFSEVSNTAIDLIRRMMTLDPVKRIAMRQVLLHSWLHDRTMQERVETLLSYDENSMPTNGSRTNEANRNLDGMLAPLAKRTRYE